MRSSLVAASLSLSLLHGCIHEPHDCTLIACSDSLSLRLAPLGGTFAAGVYEIEAELDGVIETCSITVGDGGGIDDETCNAIYYLTPTEQWITIQYPVAAQVRYVVRKDGVAMASDQLAPAYQRNQPNGPDCEPTCQQAQIDVGL